MAVPSPTAANRTPPFTIPPTDTTSSTDMQCTVSVVAETVKCSARSAPVERHRWGGGGSAVGRGGHAPALIASTMAVKTAFASAALRDGSSARPAS